MAVICYANDPPKTDTFGSSSFPKVPAFILITEMSQRNLRFLIDLLPFYFRVLQPEPNMHYIIKKCDLTHMPANAQAL